MYYLNVFVCCANLAFILADHLEESSVNFPKSKTSKTNNLYPPISMIRQMNMITDELEFIRKFVVGAKPPIGDESRFDENIGLRFGGERVSKPPTPKAARCQPELRTVDLQDVNDPTLVYFPCCTRVERCGGCCTHGLLSCQPTEIEYKNFTVNAYKYVSQGKVEPFQDTQVTVEIHKKCNCNCKIQAKDCTPLQEYNETECSCRCSNKEAEKKCPNDELTLWNPSTCSCECRNTPQCSTRQIFNPTSCSCANVLESPNVQESNYNSYYLHPN